MGLFRIWKRWTRETRRPLPQTWARPIPREMRFPVVQPNRPQPRETIVSGPCWVIDGDTIVINKMHIRLAGIDAPELDHPWGQQAKWAMVKLCKGQTVTAHLKPETSYDRLVAVCLLPDGRDLAAELVKAGLALDWPKFSGGKYRSLETADARQKLWRAHLRQGGMMLAATASQFVPVPVPVAKPRITPLFRRLPDFTPVVHNAPRLRINYRLGWLIASGALVLLVGCSFIGRDADPTLSAGSSRQASTFASFAVTAKVLNVREEWRTKSNIVAQIGGGTIVIPKYVSGNWFGIEMPDGSTGWVHSDFLSQTRD